MQTYLQFLRINSHAIIILVPYVLSIQFVDALIFYIYCR
jgi:tryptophan-rich sensory protein